MLNFAADGDGGSDVMPARHLADSENIAGAQFFPSVRPEEYLLTVPLTSGDTSRSGSWFRAFNPAVLRDSTHDIAVLAFGECPESFGGHITGGPDRQGELGDGVIIRKFGD